MEKLVLCCLVLAFFSTHLLQLVEPSTTAGTGNTLSLAQNLNAVQIDPTNGLPYVPVTRYFDFNIRFTTLTVNCSTQTVLTVNDKFPGPTIYAVEGDRIVVNVTNNANANITIHWHGVKQTLSGWQDGTAYITQCPLQQGDYFVYNFTVADQRGTVFWHAHTSWARYSLHGALVVYPSTLQYPFKRPDSEFNVIIGEWWNNITLAAQRQTTADAYTLNGLTGPLYACGGKNIGGVNEDISTLNVEAGKTYMLRVINAAVNTFMYFVVANHTLEVVEVDSSYVVPFQTPYLIIAPGQTTNVLLTADQAGGSFYMGSEPHHGDVITQVNLSAPLLAAATAPAPPPPIGIIKYPGLQNAPILFPSFPAHNDSKIMVEFEQRLHGLSPVKVPTTVDRVVFMTMGVGIQFVKCPVGSVDCLPYDIFAWTNNISFVEPKIALLEAAYFNIPGVYTTDYPNKPPNGPFNYTSDVTRLTDEVINKGTPVSVIEWGETVQVVLQGVSFFAKENHPFHLHGQSFYVLGTGFGNFDPNSSPASFNLVDPPERFTVNVPAGGWTVIRFQAKNPGMWLFHCHMDRHSVIGMQMVFYVKNGPSSCDKLPPPPTKLTSCPT